MFFIKITDGKGGYSVHEAVSYRVTQGPGIENPTVHVDSDGVGGDWPIRADHAIYVENNEGKTIDTVWPAPTIEDLAPSNES